MRSGRTPRPQALARRGLKLIEKFRRTGNISLLTEAVALLRAAAANTPNGHARAGIRLNNLSGALQLLSEWTGDIALMIEAAETARRAVAATTSTEPRRPVMLINLSTILDELAERTGDMAVRAESVQAARDAAASLPPGHRARGAALSSLSIALQTLASYAEDDKAIVEAAQVAREAVAVTPSGHPMIAARNSNLANILWQLYERTGQDPVLAEAERAARDAVAISRRADPERPAYLNTLGGLSLSLYQRTGEAGWLAKALRASREAADVASGEHPRRGACLDNLGCSLRAEFERTGDLEALTEAVQVGRDAVIAGGDDLAARAGYLNNLGLALQALTERTAEAAVLAEAIHVAREAVSITPDGDLDQATYLSNLSALLRIQAERTGDAAIATQAVQAAREAVAIARDNHSERGAYLHNLGIALRLKFGLAGDSAALTEAAQAGQDAVIATPSGHPGLARRMSDLSLTLRDVSERITDSAALTAAVQAARDAVDASAQGPSPTVLSILSIALQTLFQRTGDGDVLAAGTQAARDALALVPGGHPDRPAHLSNLSIALQFLSASSGDLDCLLEAAQAGREAVATTASAGAEVAGRLVNLGNALEMLSERTGEPSVLAEAVECFLQAAENERAPIARRVGAYRSVARLSHRAGRSRTGALDAIERAISLLPQLGPRVLARADQEHALGRLSLLAGEAAAAALDAGSPDRAVTLLEQTRGILVADALDARGGGVTRLRERTLPDVRDLAAEGLVGPIVFVYASLSRSDALILSDNDVAPVRVVPLTGLTEDNADRQIERLQQALDRAAEYPTSRAPQADVLAVLAWIWDAIAGPVLEALGHTSTPAEGEAWPRIWWCPVGTLAYLPLHAAGRHSSQAGHQTRPQTVLDLVVSSYTSTVRSLAYARDRCAGPATDTTLIVAVPDAPGTLRLRGVAEEARVLAASIPGAQVLPHPTRDSVLAALAHHSIVHFACHGYASSDNPGASRLILYDHRRAPLTVRDISDVGDLQQIGRLAYLSACETSVTTPALANEALHITGAFQLAGYQNVIGTLWPVNDVAAMYFAKYFYDCLTCDATTVPDTSQASYALHLATRRLRSRYPDYPSIWAAHSHTGI